MSKDVVIREVRSDDWADVARIYNQFIRDTVVTFEEAELTAEQIGERVAAVQAKSLPWLLAVRDSRVVGYAYATEWKGRSAYRYSVETTIYLEPAACGSGLGRRLYSQLMTEIQAASVHVAIGGITLPNAASVALHESLGFKKVAHFSEVGYKFERWLDVGYWQRVFP